MYEKKKRKAWSYYLVKSLILVWRSFCLCLRTKALKIIRLQSNWSVIRRLASNCTCLDSLKFLFFFYMFWLMFSYFFLSNFASISPVGFPLFPCVSAERCLGFIICCTMWTLINSWVSDWLRFYHEAVQRNGHEETTPDCHMFSHLQAGRVH